MHDSSLFSLLSYGKGGFFMHKTRHSSDIFRTARHLTLAAMLTAMSVVIGIFCKNFLNFYLGLFRITFENLPIILAGILFGPVTGALVGISSDLISYFMSSQAFAPNLIVTLGAATVGIVSGTVARFIVRQRSVRQIVISGAAAHILGSMIIKPIGLYSYYGILVLWRIPLYMVIAPIEIILICMIYKNTALRKILDGAGGSRP